MNFKFFSLLVFLSLAVLSCEKYKDPDPVDLDDQLTNPYCNDPRAVNYNWGFPGKPDSTVCYFPVDSFLGNWIFVDSIFFEDETFNVVDTKNLIFTSTEDSLKRHLELKGWCSNNTVLFLTADKFKNATLDDLIEDENGQLGCINSDTLSGLFNKNFIGNDSIKIEITENSNQGIKFHRGFAIRQ